MANEPKDDMRTAATASEDALHALFGDDFRSLRATAAAIDRVNALMRPGLNAETLMNGRTNELPVIDLRGRDIRYEFDGVFRGKQQWTCYDANSYDGAPDSDSNHIGYGDSKEMALVDLMDKLPADEPPPAPRMRLVDGGGGVSPPEYEPAPYRDVDEPQ